MAQYYTQKEFAEYLGVSTSYVSSLVKSGKLTLVDGKLSSADITKIYLDIIRKYNNKGTLIINLTDIDKDTIEKQYLSYYNYDEFSKPRYIENIGSYMNLYINGDSLLTNESYVKEVRTETVKSLITSFIKDYTNSSDRYFISLIRQNSNAASIPANLLYSYILFGSFNNKDSSLTSELQAIKDNYFTELKQIDTYMSNIFTDLCAKYGFLKTSSASKIDIAKYLLINRTDLNYDFIKNSGVVYEKLSTILLGHDFSINSTLSHLNNKVFKNLQYKSTKELVTEDLRDGYFIIHNFTTVEQLIKEVGNDFCKNIVFLGTQDDFINRVGTELKVFNTLITALQMNTTFVDSFIKEDTH